MFLLSVYRKLFNVDSVRGHYAVKNIIDAGLFCEMQDGCQDGRHKICYILVHLLTRNLSHQSGYVTSASPSQLSLAI